MNIDVAVIGGSFAGLSAAMQLARARRQVLLVDAGSPRNRFAAASHGFFGHDGTPPAQLIETARAQLLAYPTVRWLPVAANGARAVGAGFELDLADGSTAQARRVVLATGLRDEVDDVPGMAERWGTSVLHCPYCHGYEVADVPLGVLGNHPMSAHKAVMIPDWGPTTFFTQGRFEPDAELAAQLQARKVTIERSPVVALLGTAPALDGVKLADGRIVPLRALFTAPRAFMASDLASQLGCAIDEGPMGPMIRVDERKQTTVPGVFAAGDAANAMHNGTLASASGVLAGVGAHQSLMVA